PPTFTLFPYTTLFRSNMDYARLPDDDPRVRNAYFRGRRSSIEASFWHYAFLRSVEGFLPYEINLRLTEGFTNAARSVEELTKFIDRKSTRLNSSHVKI